MRALVLSIDLDGPPEYAAIHGLPPAPPSAEMYRGPLCRFARLCDRVGGPGTAFVIGRDLSAETAELLGPLREEGWEIGDHSFDHDYRLSRRPPPDIVAELERSRAAHRRWLGAAPLGFRAPGYLLSPTLLDAVERLGYRYDSSLMPSPPYYFAKLAVLLAYRLTGHTSASLADTPSASLAPRQPYRPAQRPHQRGHRRLLELPIAVATAARLPVTGASLVMAPPSLRAVMLRALASEEVLVINLHGMDLLDPESEPLSRGLRSRQPELRIPIAERQRILGDALERLARGRQILTAERLAESWLAGP